MKGSDLFDLPDLRSLDPASYVSPPLDSAYLEQERARFAALYAATDRALVTRADFSLPVGYMAPFAWGIYMLEEPEPCRRIILAQAEAEAGRARQWLEAVGEYVSVAAVGGVDWGMQDREAVLPDLFREIVAPGWKIVNDVVHAVSTVKTWYHCCGSVSRIIPAMVDAGLDCLNPVQWSAANMDPRWLKESFGDRVVFWGGAINTQHTFPHGTPEEVAREARQILDIFAPGGGYVVNPIHNTQADVPVENIIALYDTALAYRYSD
jgi:uroporphyrinogen-III decarboxylase